MIKRDYMVYVSHLDLADKSWLVKVVFLVFRSTFFFLMLFRMTSSSNVIARLCSIPIYKVARILSGIHIRRGTIIGPGLLIPHCGNIVINNKAIVGKNCVILHNVTIAAKGRSNDDGVPVVGDNVYIGVGAVLLGTIQVGNNSVIGACSVVTRDVEADSVVAGNPARVIRRLDVR